MSRRNSNRRSSRNRRKNGTDIQALVKMALGIVILGGLFTSLFIVKGKTDAIDPVSFCQRAGPAEVHIVLLDASDTMDGVQAERVKATIFKSAKASSPGSRLDIYVADTPDGRLAEPVFSKCNPGEPDKFAAAYSDAKAQRESFETEFLYAIEETLSTLLNAKAAPTSPIIESIRSAAAKSLSRLDDDTPVHITIVSDMVQNSPLLKQHINQTDFETFKAGVEWPNALSDLHNARIHIVYLARSQYRAIQGRAHQAWWEAYFDAVHGRLTGIDSI